MKLLFIRIILSYFKSKILRKFGFYYGGERLKIGCEIWVFLAAYVNINHKYKRKNNKNSLLNNLYSETETSNLEYDFFPKTNLFSIRSL